MASICVHRATRTPPDSTPEHIRSRDVLQEFGRPATHGPQSPVPYFPAIHLARQSPFYGPPGHIRSRDDFQEFGRPATHGRQGPVPHFPAIHLARQSPFHGPPGHIPVPGGTKLGSPGPFSGANCLIINNDRCQVNFTKARCDSIRPGRHSVLLILPENLGKSPQPRHLNQATSTKIVQNLDSKMVLIIFASYDTRQPSAWRQTHEAQTGATCANKRNKREHVQTSARGTSKRKQPSQPGPSKRKQASPTKRKQAQTRQKQYQNLRTVWRKTP